MSLQLSNIPQISYRGTAVTLPLAPGVSLAVFALDWFSYPVGATAPDLAVICPVNTGNAPLSAIRAVRIDNAGCPFPVAVVFPDTGDSVTCEAFGQSTFNVLTTSKTPLVIARGFALATGTVRTTVMFSNAALTPQSDSAVNSNISSDAGIVAAPLADRNRDLFFSLLGGGSVEQLVCFSPAPISGTFFLNAMDISLYNLTGAQAASVIHTLTVRGFQSHTVYKTVVFSTPPAIAAGFTRQLLYSVSGINLRVPTAEAISCNVTAGAALVSAGLQASFNYTYVSNNANLATA